MKVIDKVMKEKISRDVGTIGNTANSCRISGYFPMVGSDIQFRLLKAKDLYKMKNLFFRFLSQFYIYTGDPKFQSQHESNEEKMKLYYIENINLALNENPNLCFIWPDGPLRLETLIRIKCFNNKNFEQILKITPSISLIDLTNTNVDEVTTPITPKLKVVNVNERL